MFKGKKGMEETVGMIAGVILAMIIVMLLISHTWGPVGEAILEVNSTSEAAYGNLSETYTMIPEETTDLFEFIFIAVLISVIIGVYALWKKFQK